MVVRFSRTRAALAALVAFTGFPAQAQVYPAANYPDATAPAPADPIDTLSAHLRTLAVSPRNYIALIGAGDAALQVGDPNAALGFFARAEQVDPRSGKAKAGLASALVALERPNDALPLFAQAVALGVAEADIARDRGLAYDLRGDTKLAQRDYALALRRGADDEITRRYALSLGISGQRAEAMALLDPLLRKRDQSAWRARAFILAMNGDVSGANGIARQVMPANLAATMSPFLTRLATLNAADRAHAVNFGTMPSNGTALAAVEIGDPFTPVGGPRPPASSSSTGAGLIPAGEPFGPRPVDVQPTRVAAPLSNDPRRIPGRDPVTVASNTSQGPVFPPAAAPGFTVTPSAPPPSVEDRFGGRPGGRIAAIDPAKLPPEARGGGSPSVVIVSDRALPSPQSAAAAPVVVKAPAPQIVTPAPAPMPIPTPTAVAAASPTPVKTELPPSSAATEATPAPTPPPAPATTTAALPSSTAAKIGPPAEAPTAETEAAVTVPSTSTTTQTPQPAPSPTPTPAPTPASAASPASRLASILDGVTPEAEAPAALPTAAEIRAARRLAEKKAEAAAAATAAAQAEKDAKAAEALAARQNPARLWVQIATGSNTRGLAGTWARIRDDNAALLKGKSAWTVPFKATNRLLVGPMKSPADARALVNALAKGGVSATTFSSDAGQEVARVGGK